MQTFKIQMSKSPVITVYAGILAWAVPIIEIAIVCLLIFKKTQLIGLYAAFTLMVIFSAYIISILNFSYYIPCSCGGILQNMTWSVHLYFNIITVIACAIGILLYSPQPPDHIIIAQ